MTASAWARLTTLLTVLVVASGCAAPGLTLRDLPGITRVDGHPFSALPLRDGALLVSLSNGDGDGGVIEILHPTSDGFFVRGSFPMEGRPAALALSHDGDLVAVAADRATLVLDRARLLGVARQSGCCLRGDQDGYAIALAG